MAKDRFSKFKKSNYSKEYRYGNHNQVNYKPLPNRVTLNKIQIQWLENLRDKLKKRPSINFINSILEQGYVPTKLQKEIIKTIIKNG